MASPERRARRIDTKLPRSGGGSTAQAAAIEPAPPSIPVGPAPTNLAVTGTYLIASAVSPQAAANLSWRAPAPEPDSYIVQWSTSGSFTNVTSRAVARGQTTAGVDSLPVNTLVYFRVAAITRGVQSAWSNTASTTTPSDTTPPAAPTSLVTSWSGLTGDLTISWTNPASVNFRDVRVRIYASNGGALLREIFIAAAPYVWTRGQHYADTSGIYDPSVYLVLTARSWGGVFSASDLTGTVTLAVPSTPSGLTSSWASDTGTAGAACVITWTASSAVERYRLSIDGVSRDVLGGRFVYEFEANRAEHSGTPDPVLSLSLVAVDALGQVSTAATNTATNAAPPATTITAFGAFSQVGLTIGASTAADIKDYRVRVYLNTSLVRTVYFTDLRPTYVVEDGDGSYTFDVAARDLFGQVGTASSQTSATVLTDMTAFVADLRSGLIYSDSISTAEATLAALKDGDLTTNVVTYASGSTWKWTQGDWQEEITHQTSEFVNATTASVYMSTSSDGSTWTYFYGGTPSSGRLLLTTSTGTEATAQSGAVSLTAGTWRVDLPAPRRCRYIRIHHRNTGASYALREFFPSTLIRGTYVQAESITAVNIAVGTLTGDRLTATAINGFTITGATIQTAASGERVVLDSTGLKTYDASSNVVIEATTATDGALLAGVGAVTLNRSGLSIYGYSSGVGLWSGGSAPDEAASRIQLLQPSDSAVRHYVQLTDDFGPLGGTKPLTLRVNGRVAIVEASNSAWLAVNDGTASLSYYGITDDSPSLIASIGTGVTIGSSGLSVLGDLTVSGNVATGSWTPAVSGSGGAGSGITYSAQEGFYLKLGKIIMLRGRVAISAVTTPPSGDFRITGLPFTIANRTNGYWFGTGYGENQDVGTGKVQFAFRASPNVTYLDIVETADNGAAGVTAGGVVVVNLGLFFSITYEAA